MTDTCGECRCFGPETRKALSTSDDGHQFIFWTVGPCHRFWWDGKVLEVHAAWTSTDRQKEIQEKDCFEKREAPPSAGGA